jgi:hypothetical protein
MGRKTKRLIGVFAVSAVILTAILLGRLRYFEHAVMSPKALAHDEAMSYFRMHPHDLDGQVRVWEPKIQLFKIGIVSCPEKTGCEFLLVDEENNCYKLNRFGKLLAMYSLREANH